MNRQQKRHKHHPLLPMLNVSKKRILDTEKTKTFSHAKGYHSRRRGKWKVI